MAIVDFDLNCVACKSSLRDADTDGQCPHCGHRVIESIDLEVIDLNDTVVAGDVACSTCGYNLRTLKLDAVCPECGRDVVGSLRPDDLRFADRLWLWKVHGGARTLQLVLIPIPVAFLIMLLLPLAGMAGMAAGIVILIALAACSVGGMTYLVTADPRRSKPIQLDWISRLARSYVVYFFALPVVLAYAGASRSPTSMVVALVLLCLWVFGLFTSFVCVTLCVRRIAVRSRSRRLAKSFAALTWLTAVLGVWTLAVFPLIAVSEGWLYRMVGMTFPATGESFIVGSFCFLAIAVYLLALSSLAGLCRVIKAVLANQAGEPEDRNVASGPSVGPSSVP